ncbi:sugar-binding domain-containing protein [Bacillus sp. ISL-46]|uniref:sugar-binding domain-containing protein n=1 Tax=Bacillus sp. ISL-46 TaxID=2819129 RepID=UPI0020350E67|nr:sugar-binding domain-containing protein [Bacillus sp. ISL-46]
MGAAASKYLLRVIRDGQTIGVSSRTTLHEVAEALSTNQQFPSVTFVPLVGGMGNERVDIHANALVAKLAGNLQAQYKLLYAPVMVDSNEAKKILMLQSSIQDIFDLAAKANIAN